jgi:hypothetical protein
MSDSEMMADRDDVFTDRRLGRTMVENHLAATGATRRLAYVPPLFLESGSDDRTQRGASGRNRSSRISRDITRSPASGNAG